MKDKRYLVIETENSRAMEKFHGFGFIGQELKHPMFFIEAVNGFVERPIGTPPGFRNVNITLELQSVMEAVICTMGEVKEMAAQRAKN